MNASLRSLLSGVIDYAGLFPPANLPLDEAIRSYARYRQEPDAWMLGRFVIPAARLSELDAFADILQQDPPLRLSILGRGGTDREAFLKGIGDDYTDTLSFSARHAGRVVADVYEARLPTPCNVRWLIPMTAEIIGPLRWALFVEGALDANAVEHLGSALGRVAARFREKPANQGPVAPTGFKLRCGGLEASAFPSVDQVAFVLRVCRDAGAPLKFTAGLHHPIRRFDAGVQTHMHGFINVFVAGVLAHARRLNEDWLRAVIADEDPTHFVFAEDGVGWKDLLGASADEIAAARRDFVTSFGSCSFDEPRDDLRALGWL
jgi:hypothetical protein